MNTQTLIPFITRAFAMKGQASSTEDVVFIAMELAKILDSRQLSLSDQEIAIAFNNGIFGEYGDYYGINAVTCYEWICGYLSSPERRRFVESRRDRLLQRENPPTEAEMTAYGRNIIRELYRHYMKHRNLDAISGNRLAIIISINYIIRKGYIKAVEVTEADREKALDWCLKNLSENDIKMLRRDPSKSSTYKYRCLYFARTRTLEEFFKSRCNEDKEIPGKAD